MKAGDEELNTGWLAGRVHVETARFNRPSLMKDRSGGAGEG